MPHFDTDFLREYRVIITIVCSYNFYYTLENLYCVKHEFMYIVSSRGRSSLLRNLSWFLPRSALMKFYEAYILPTFDYCDVVWFCCTRTQALKLERLQNYAGRVILKEPRISSATSIRKKLGWTTLESRRNTHMATHIFKTLKNAAPSYLQTLLQPHKTTGYHTRGAVCGNLLLPQPRTEAGKKAFSFSAPRLWNSLPDEAKGLTSLTLFTACMRSHFNTV